MDAATRHSDRAPATPAPEQVPALHRATGAGHSHAPVGSLHAPFPPLPFASSRSAMPRFNANLTMLFTERPFLDRFEAAAKAGFTGVEYLFPYDFAVVDLVQRLKAHGLTQALHNMPAGAGPAASAASRSCRAARTSSRPASKRPSPMPRRWTASRSIALPALLLPASRARCWKKRSSQTCALRRAA
jgi:hypothetical protein